MARPAKSADEKLLSTFSFRLTEADYSTYQQKVRASGLSNSEFFRKYVLTNTTQVVAKDKSPASKMAVFLLQKASNNINQIAHRVNSENVSGALSEASFQAIILQLETLNGLLLSQVQETLK